MTENGGAVLVEFGVPFCPEPGEHDVVVVGIRTADSRFGKVLYLDMLLLDPGPDYGAGFSFLYGLPRPGRTVTEGSKLGQLLRQMGYSVEEWARERKKLNLTELLLNKRMRIVTGKIAKSGQQGTFEVPTLAAVKKVYQEGEGPDLPPDMPPF